MMKPGRILDLIEAIEISATRNKYKLSLPQLHLINHLKQRSLRNLPVYDESWDNLCDLFNRVEGRYNNNLEKFIIDEGKSASFSCGLYMILPLLICLFVLSLGLIVLFVRLIK